MPAGGRVEFDHVWVDDRMGCCWALADVSFVLEPGDMAAVLDTEGSHGGHAIIDLLLGRRRPFRGSVTVEGEVREFLGAAAGERRAVVAGRTVLVAEPGAEVLGHADLVLALDHGALGRDGRSQRALVTESRGDGRG